MNTTIEVPQQVFHDALDADEQRALEALINQHRGNAALTQQLALDASRLVSTSQERLSKQVDAGFCKRLIGAISGSNHQNALSSQVDMLKMQKVAWHYLQQLQQQNLINAQAIAVIRNNLGTMNEFIIETRNFLGEAIGRINGRLRPIENNTRLAKWSLNIEANKRRYKSLPASLLVVQLSYDFLRKHSDVELTLEDINHLVVTLENLGINCDDDVRLLDFIIELVDQMDVTGIDLYRESIEVSTEDHTVESAFIQANVSGIGFNALYYLSDHYTKIMALIGDSELCNTDAAREKIISRIFGDAFDGLATTYKLRHLISEIVGGGLLAIDIYHDLHGLNAQPVLETSDEHTEEYLPLVSDLPDIHVHSYLDVTTDADDRRDYVQLLALCMEDPANCGRLGKDFVTHLANKADAPEALAGFLLNSTSPQQQQAQLQRLRALLTDSDRTYCWIMDAFFLLTIEKKKVETPQVMRILNALKPPQLKEHLSCIQAVLRESEADRVLKEGATLSRLTRGWTNILLYREMRFKEFFADRIDALDNASLAVSKLSFESLDVLRKAMEYSCYIGLSPFDESFLSKVGSALGSRAFSIGRKSSMSALNQLRVKVKEFVSSHSSALAAANSEVLRFAMPTFDFEDECGFSDFDLDNSAENEQWSDQFEHYQHRLEKTLDSFSRACDDAACQLRLFSDGNFTQSIAERRTRELENAKQRKREDDLTKRSILIERNGEELQFIIEWENMQSPPCDPESVRDIKTDGTRWLIATDQGGYYLSEDRARWEEVHPFGPEGRTAKEIAVIDGVWVLTVYGEEGFTYSHDGRSWKQTQYPDSNGDYSLSSTDEIVHLDGAWIWRFTRRRKYQYTEKGFLFDSEKSSSYDESLLFSTPSLDGEWSRWEGNPSLAEGMQIDALRAIPGIDSLLIFCSYDWGYERGKKKTDTDPLVKYYIPDKGWRNCTWDGEKIRRSTALVTRMGDRLMCFSSNQLLSSVKGYDWRPEQARIAVRGCFHLDGMSIFPSLSDGQVLLLSQDGCAFKEITLENGTWNYLCATNQGALSIYSPNAHETWLRTGKFVFHPKL